MSYNSLTGNLAISCNSLPEEETALPGVSIPFSALQAALPLPPPSPGKTRGPTWVWVRVCSGGRGSKGSGHSEAPCKTRDPQADCCRPGTGTSSQRRRQKQQGSGGGWAGGRGRTPSQVATWSAPPHVAPPRPVLRPHPVRPAHSRPAPSPSPSPVRPLYLHKEAAPGPARGARDLGGGGGNLLT